MLRIESGLIFAGYEFDDQVDPFEAGVGFAVDLETDDDFVGRAALEERKAHPQRTLVGLELEGNETAGHGDEVYVGRQRVGVVTSGTRSPVLKKNIALARVAVQYAELGHRSRSGSSTASRSGSPQPSSASRSTTPRRPGRAPDRRLHSRAGRRFPARRLPDRRGWARSERALEPLRERYLRLFDGEYETGIRPDEVNWVPGRDPEDRTRQLCNAWKPTRSSPRKCCRSVPVASRLNSRGIAECGSCRTTCSGSRRGRRRSDSTRTPRTPTISSLPRWSRAGSRSTRPRRTQARSSS